MPSTSTELTLPGDPASVPAARRFVADALEELGLDEAAWAAQLCVSELATNAALHAKTEFTISVAPDRDGAVRIEVRDGSRRTPRVRQYDGEATTGRGLQILDELAIAWGVELVEGGGKVVWVLVDARPDARGGDGREAGELLDVHLLLEVFNDDEDWDLPKAHLGMAA